MSYRVKSVAALKIVICCFLYSHGLSEACSVSAAQFMSINKLPPYLHTKADPPTDVICKQANQISVVLPFLICTLWDRSPPCSPLGTN